jgi:hypothetical protein
MPKEAATSTGAHGGDELREAGCPQSLHRDLGGGEDHSEIVKEDLLADGLALLADQQPVPSVVRALAIEQAPLQGGHAGRVEWGGMRPTAEGGGEVDVVHAQRSQLADRGAVQQSEQADDGLMRMQVLGVLPRSN